MVKGLIEFACTGNHGRSEPCRIIAQYELALTGLQEFEATSSGTLVDAIAKDLVPISDNIRCIQLALERGDVYNSEQASRLCAAIHENDKGPINDLYPVCRNIFDREEEEWRNEWLAGFNQRQGIEARFKETIDQTRVNPNVVALFTMSKSNQGPAEDMYRDSGYNPLIQILPVFVTGDKDAVIINGFGKNRETYQATAAQLEDFVPKAIDKFLRQYQ